jgi:uncharacterized protein YndB with AHSA1/START domain
MDRRTNLATQPAELVLLLTRTFDAPRGVVFKAWTEPPHVMRWWGPNGFVLISCEMDVRAGGTWRVHMRGPRGQDDRQHLVYREVVEPERIVFSYAFEDAMGKTGHETLVTVTFEEYGDKTRLTLHQAIFETAEVRDDHVSGWSDALDHFAEYLKKVG